MLDTMLFATSATPACDHAARVAFGLAQKYGANLTLLHVLGEGAEASGAGKVDDEQVERAWEDLRAFYAKRIGRCGRCMVEVTVGNPYREILRMARLKEADMIVMGTRSSDDAAFLRPAGGIVGTTLQRVVRSAPCPVLTVSRPSASFWGGISNIVLATDLSPASDRAFDYALSLAKGLECDLHLFHALDMTLLHPPVYVSQDEIERMLREARGAMRERYMPKLRGFKKADMEIWEGIPYVEIVKFARERQADLLVMAHSGREPDPEQDRSGSTLDQVAARATCPVAIVSQAAALRK